MAWFRALVGTAYSAARSASSRTFWRRQGQDEGFERAWVKNQRMRSGEMSFKPMRIASQAAAAPSDVIL